MYRKFFIDKYLEKDFTFETAVSEVDFALDVLFNYQYKDFMLGKKLEDWQIKKIENVIFERVTTHRPIQQIIGQAYFLSKKFFVDKYTLIPRPETEILVSETVKISKQFENPQILDIGTGTGCIAICTALGNEKARIQAVDISRMAIETAKKNALLHNVYDKINFYTSDIFENVKEKFDIIVSNPPYIPLKDKDSLQIEVRDYDPASALFTEDDKGLQFYEEIILSANEYLNKNGFILFELGIKQAEDVKELLKENNFDIIDIIKDFNGIDRVIIGKSNL